MSGIIGAVVLPVLSDRLQTRAPFFIAAIALLVPAYLGLTFVDNAFAVGVIAGIAGFTIMGVAPILFQHGSEAAYPVQEGTSLGILLLMGQISGTLFVYLFEWLTDSLGTIVWPMLLLVVMNALLLPCVWRLREATTSSPASPSTWTRSS